MKIDTPQSLCSNRVPCSTPLENGTVEQNAESWNKPRNITGISNLELAALKVLEQNKPWNKAGTNHKNSGTSHETESVPKEKLLILDLAKKCLERLKKPTSYKKNNDCIVSDYSCSTFSASREWNSGTSLQNDVPMVGTKIDGINFYKFEDINIPYLWQDAVKRTIQREKPLNITQSKWNAIIAQIHLWIGQNLAQLQKIIATGWTLQDVFGCHCLSPQRIDSMGLLMLLQGKTIDLVSSDGITLKTSSGAIQTFYKKRVSAPEDDLIYNIGLCLTLPGTGEVVESATATIDTAGLTDLAWIQPKLSANKAEVAIIVDASAKLVTCDASSAQSVEYILNNLNEDELMEF